MSVTNVGRAGAAATAAPLGEKKEAELRKVADQLAGVFAEQLFKAMRDTVPKGQGAFDGGSGEEMFSGLMDQHVATETSTQWSRGLTDTIVRQLRSRLQQTSALPGSPEQAPALDPLRAPDQLHALQQTPQSLPLQPLPDASR